MSNQKKQDSRQLVDSHRCALLLKSLRGERNLRDYTLILLCLKTGLRNAEVCQLNGGDVRKSGRIAERLTVRPAIAQGKTGRRLPLCDEVRGALRTLLQWKGARGEPLSPDSPLFCTSLTKKRLVPRDFQRMMEKGSLKFKDNPESQ